MLNLLMTLKSQPVFQLRAKEKGREIKVGIIGEYLTNIFSAVSSVFKIPFAEATGPLEAAPGIIKIATIRNHANDLGTLLFPNGKLTPEEHQKNAQELNKAYENLTDAQLWQNVGGKK